MALPKRLLFLPGASGDTSFWRPLERRLEYPAERLHLGCPRPAACDPRR